MLALAIAVNAGAAIPWWIGLLASPEFRRWFLPHATPDSALLSFAAADAILFWGAGLLAAYAIWNRKPWANAVLLLHTGAACYASLYTLLQFVLTGEAWLSAAAMLPGLFLLPFACWKLRP